MSQLKTADVDFLPETDEPPSGAMFSRAKNPKETVECSGTYNEERELSEFYTQK